MRDKELDPLESIEFTIEDKPKEDTSVNKGKAKASKTPKAGKAEKPSNTADNEAKEKIKDKIATNDIELRQLYDLLAPDDYEIGISDKRIQRARLVCQSIDRYDETEKQYLVYPTLYQLHLYGYHIAEISAILGLAPSTIHTYLKNIRQAFKHQYLEDRTSEEIVSESIAHYDFIAKEANRLAAQSGIKDSERAGYMRLSAQAETAKNEILDRTGYFDMIKRRNELQALDSSNTSGAKEKNELMDDIKEIVAEFKVIKENE